MPNRLTATELLELFEAYLEWGSIDKVARECNRNWHTVRKHAQEGGWAEKRKKWLDLAQKELGIDSVELTKENLNLIRGAKAKVAQKIKADDISVRLSDLPRLIQIERLLLGQSTEKVDTPAATLNNLVIVGDNGSEQVQFEDEKAGQEEIEILGKYLEIKQNGNPKGRPANRLKKQE